MIVGDPSVFAIESCISQAFARPSFLGLGYFVVFINGQNYGIKEPDATMLACSFDEITNRLRERGTHNAEFGITYSAAEIANAFRREFYGDTPKHGTAESKVITDLHLVYSNRILWAPDGDEAFDDGSYILQFDSAEQVRLIAFKTGQDSNSSPASLTDLWLSADRFYTVLDDWLKLFRAEWHSMPKQSS